MSKRPSHFENRNASSTVRQRRSEGGGMADEGDIKESDILIAEQQQQQDQQEQEQEQCAHGGSAAAAADAPIHHTLSILDHLDQHQDVQEIIYLQLGNRNLEQIGMVERKRKMYKTEQETALLVKQKALWKAPHPSYESINHTLYGNAIVPTQELRVAFLDDGLFAHLKHNVVVENQLSLDESCKRIWLSEMSDLMRNTCPIGIESEHHVFAYPLWKKQLLQLIVKYRMNWTLFESPWCTVVCTGGNQLRISCPDWSSRLLKRHFLRYILRDAGWKELIRSDIHRKTHKHLQGCCRLPKFIRHHIYEQLLSGMVTSMQVQIQSGSIHVDLSMVHLPIFPPNDQCLPTFGTCIEHLNEYMKFPLLSKINLVEKIQLMKVLYPASIFVLGRREFRLTKQRVSEVLKESCIHLNQTEPLHLSQNENIEVPKSMLNILSLLLPRPNNYSLNFKNPDHQDFLFVIISCVLYNHGCVPQNDTEDANQQRQLNFNERDIEEGVGEEEGEPAIEETEEKEDENKVPVVDKYESLTLAAQLIENTPMYSSKLSFVEAPKDIYSIFQKMKQQKQFCRDEAPDFSYCTKQLLNNHPECIERCDDLFVSAFGALLSHRGTDHNFQHFRPGMKLMLHTSPGLSIYIQSNQKTVSLHFTGIKAKQELLDMTPQETELFMLDIGSPTWISNYADDSFAHIFPNAWNASNDLLKTLYTLLKVSHMTNMDRGFVSPFGASHTLSFELGGGLEKTLNIPSVQVYEHMNESTLSFSQQSESLVQFAKMNRNKTSMMLSLIKSSQFFSNHKILAMYLTYQKGILDQAAQYDTQRFAPFISAEFDVSTSDHWKSNFEFRKICNVGEPNESIVGIQYKHDVQFQEGQLKIAVENMDSFDQVKTEWLTAFFTIFTSSFKNPARMNTRHHGRVVSFVRECDDELESKEIYAKLLFNILQSSDWTRTESYQAAAAAIGPTPMNLD